MAYAIFLKVSADRGREGHAGILVESFLKLEVKRERGGEQEWKQGWWKDKNAAMKWRGKDFCEEIRLLVDVLDWSIYFLES